MKKFATAFLLMAAFAVYAGYDLALDERASYWNITPEQAGLKIGMLVSSLFPIIGIAVILSTIKFFKKHS